MYGKSSMQIYPRRSIYNYIVSGDRGCGTVRAGRALSMAAPAYRVWFPGNDFGPRNPTLPRSLLVRMEELLRFLKVVQQNWHSFCHVRGQTICLLMFECLCCFFQVRDVSSFVFFFIFICVVADQFKCSEYLKFCVYVFFSHWFCFCFVNSLILYLLSAVCARA